MALDGSGSLLILDSFGTPLYSARGLTQKLVPIEQASDLRRTINGVLDDLSVTQFRKYSSTITCRDQQAPAIDGIWPGQVVTVSCVAELAYPTAGGSPARPVVSGSLRTAGDFTFYRPMLQMMVTAVDLSLDEWQADYSWQIDLEEI